MITTSVRVPITDLLPADSPRVGGEDDDHVRMLAQSERPLPPILVNRRTMRVVDGMHRLRAVQARGADTVEVTFYEGSEQDAFVLSVRLNTTHGLPLSTADRAAAAARIVTSHPDWSNRSIAAVVGISDKTVAAVRRRSTAEIPQTNIRIGRDGRRRRLDSSDGRILASALMIERPDAPLREIAAEAGISLSMASDVRNRLRNGRAPVPARQQRADRPAAPPAAETEPPECAAPSEPVPDPMSALRELSRDPALRSREDGRKLLWLLNVHSLTPQMWLKLIGTVPPHRAAAVAQLARRCAERWNQFAQQIDRLSDETPKVG
ncbi:ParB/RepB/Spo0J family partition protein [Nocardia sp. NPDC060256]|uniref:ParB/RepB/Spo0J family partition protein n=1 Tax=unclassified Nocardia TaxID=2637762 RepID=UPI00366614F4